MILLAVSIVVRLWLGLAILLAVLLAIPVLAVVTPLFLLAAAFSPQRGRF